eukprot:TRINITY_DN1110_c1_g2_i1.p1 TRINITY_DN1110_c1_g2~~TRINITY_DN1110_c1_g2_i1.p1  ORF type:complete len:160 (+),score=70.61 TRINITY_DN1110_c1_g2_i1:159-638(+)
MLALTIPFNIASIILWICVFCLSITNHVEPVQHGNYSEKSSSIVAGTAVSASLIGLFAGAIAIKYLSQNPNDKNYSSAYITSSLLAILFIGVAVGCWGQRLWDARLANYVIHQPWQRWVVELGFEIVTAVFCLFTHFLTVYETHQILSPEIIHQQTEQL